VARARNIKPQIARNEDLAELPFQYRLGFTYSWMFADFRGVIPFRPKRLKADLFPYDDIDIEDFVNCLAKAGFFRVFTVQGQRYIKIVKFEKHQNPHKHEREAGTDLPDIADVDPPEAPDKKAVTPKAVQSTDKADTSTSPAVPLPDSLNTDSLIPDSGEETASPTPPADTTPAQIKLVKKIAKLVPNRAVWDDIVDAIGDEPDEEKLRLCFKTWVAKGFKPKNLAWISDWYAKGIPSYQNGKPKLADPGKQTEPAVDDLPPCGHCNSRRRIFPDGDWKKSFACPECSKEVKAA
jgi:hypothetical protein